MADCTAPESMTISIKQCESGLFMELCSPFSANNDDDGDDDDERNDSDNYGEEMSKPNKSRQMKLHGRNEH